MTFIKKLLLSAAIILGVTAAGFAQEGQYQDYEVWTGSKTGSVYMTTSGSPQGLFGLTRGQGEELADSKFFISIDDATINGETIVYYTNDNGVTFHKATLTFSEGFGYVTRLIKLDTVDDLFAATTIKFAINGKIYSFGNKGIVEAINGFEGVKENPFGGDSDNPFGTTAVTADSFTAQVEGLNPFDLEGYIAAFVNFAEQNGLDLKYIYQYDVNIKFSYEMMKENTIAYTTTLGDDKEVNIVVNPDAWIAASPAKRVAVIFHELGHDVLNFEHDSEEGPLMSVYARGDYSYEDVFELTTQMFNDYKNGVIYSHED